MNLEQLKANIKDIQSTSPGPYYIGNGLADALSKACNSSRSSVNANEEFTFFLGVSEELDSVGFVVMTKSAPTNFLLYIPNGTGEFAEVEVQ